MLDYSQSSDMRSGRVYAQVDINIIISTVIESRRKQSRMMSVLALQGEGRILFRVCNSEALYFFLFFIFDVTITLQLGLFWVLLTILIIDMTFIYVQK